MPVTVNANGLSIVHQGSGGIAVATAPDVCKTPSPNGPVPMPYPNIAYSADLVGGSTTVKIDGCPAAIQGSKIAKSTGDEAGSAGGVVSNVFIGEATFISFSPTVMIEGKPVCRLTDKMLMNKGNTVCMGGWLQTPVVAEPLLYSEDVTCKVPPTEAPKRCVIKKVKVRCKHYNKRQVELDLSQLNAKAAKAQSQGKKKKAIDAIHVFEVLRKTTDPEVLSISWEGDCGYGNRHKNCPAVVIDSRHIPSGEKYIESANKKYDFDFDKETKRDPQTELCADEPATAPGGDMDSAYREIDKLGCNPVRITMEEVMNLLFWGDHPLAIYPEYYNLHGIVRSPDGKSWVGTEQWLQVVVYPELYCKGEFTISYQKPKNKASKSIEESNSLSFNSVEKRDVRSNLADAGKAYETDQTKWTLGGKIDFYFGQNHVNFNWEKGQTLENQFPKVGELANKVTRFLNQVNEIADYALVDAQIVWPVWKFKSTIERVEVQNSPLVSTNGSFEMGFYPLIGAGLECDIIDWIIAVLGGPLKKPLLDIKKLAANGGGDSKSFAQAKAVIKIVLSVTSEIDGKLKINIEGGKTNVDTTSIGGAVKFKVTAEVSASGRVWIVSASAGIGAGTTSADANAKEVSDKPTEIRGEFYPKKGDLFSVGARIRCTGIKIYYYYYYEIGVSGAGNSQKDDGKPRQSKESKPSASAMNRPKAGHEEAIIWKPWVWPADHV